MAVDTSACLGTKTAAALTGKIVARPNDSANAEAQRLDVILFTMISSGKVGRIP
jgi:hypothetical protein